MFDYQLFHSPMLYGIHGCGSPLAVTVILSESVDSCLLFPSLRSRRLCCFFAMALPDDPFAGNLVADLIRDESQGPLGITRLTASSRMRRCLLSGHTSGKSNRLSHSRPECVKAIVAATLWSTLRKGTFARLARQMVIIDFASCFQDLATTTGQRRGANLLDVKRRHYSQPCKHNCEDTWSCCCSVY